MKAQLIALVAVLFVYALWILIEQQYLSKVLQLLSIQHIKLFRMIAARQKGFDMLMSLATELGDKYGMIGCIWLSIHFQNQGHAFIIGAVASISLLVSQTVKSMLREPRPFLISDQIDIKTCTLIDFGNPSSDTFLSASMFITTIYLFYRDYTYKNKVKQNLMHVLVVMNILLVMLYVIGFSHVFKGFNTYNQIISGLIQGALLALVPSFIVYQDLFKFFLTLKHRPFVSLLINRYVFIFCVLFGLACQVHLDTRANFKVPQEWIDTFSKRCPNVDKSKMDPESANFQRMLQSLQLFGTYFGTAFEQKLMDSKRYNHFNDTNFATTTQRILLCFIFMLPTQYIKDIPQMILSEPWPHVETYFKYVLFPVVQGFVLFAFTKSLSIWFGLANLKESKDLVAGHDKELLSIMAGTEIKPDMYKHNKNDDGCKKNHHKRQEQQSNNQKFKHE